MKKAMVAIAITSAVAIVGCASLEKTLANMNGTVTLEETKLQLASGNAAQIKTAEDNIVRIVTTGTTRGNVGQTNYSQQQRRDFLALAGNVELLKRIASERTTMEDGLALTMERLETVGGIDAVLDYAGRFSNISQRDAVLSRIDFKKSGNGSKFLAKFGSDMQMRYHSETMKRAARDMPLTEMDKIVKSDIELLKRFPDEKILAYVASLNDIDALTGVADSIRNYGSLPEVRNAALTKIESLPMDNQQILATIDWAIEYRNHVIEDGRQKGAELVTALLRRIDLSKPGNAKRVLDNYTRWSREFDRDYVDQIVNALSEKELMGLLDEGYENMIREKIAMRMVNGSNDAKTLYRMANGDLANKVGNDAKGAALKKLMNSVATIKDEQIALEMLKMGQYQDNGPTINDRKLRDGLLAQLSAVDAIKFAVEELKSYSVHSWNRNVDGTLEDAIYVAGTVTNRTVSEKIASAVVKKIAGFEKECTAADAWRYNMSWSGDDKKRAKEFVGRLPKLSDATVESLVCADGICWAYLLDAVSEDMAYNMLSSGKAKTKGFETALVSKLPQSRLDMKVYKGVCFDEVRKQVLELMAPEMQATVNEEITKAYDSIIEKSKQAEKDTFALDGFYLGMAFADAKIVLGRLFPDFKMVESKSDKGEFELYVSHQKSPFCMADKEGKVYRFDFGKKMLKKWYKYDAADYMQWALEYGRENKMNIAYKLVEKDTTVWERDMSRSYTVWFFQHAYQAKCAAKEYRLIYFGDEKDITIHGGIGGEIIKSLAAKDFHYVRGDPGSLRVLIDKE